MRRYIAVLLLLGYVYVWANAAFMAQLSNVMYNDHPQAHYSSAKFDVMYEVIDGVPVMVLQKNGQTTVAIRGTYSMQNWLANMHMNTTQFKDIKGSKVQKAYYDIARHIVKKLKLDAIEGDIAVTGHSLGGALGLMVAALLYEDNKNITLYTFGMQAVGNSTFVKHIQNLTHYRYVHILDIVPSIESKNIQTIKSLLLEWQNSRVSKDSFLYYALEYLMHMPEDFVHHSRATMLYDFSVPRQDILPHAWMLPAYYHLAANYAHVLKP